MKAIKVLMVMIPFTFGASAQDSLAVKKYVGVYTDLGIGCLCGIPMENVNRVLFFRGLPSIPQSMVATHLGAGIWFKRFSFELLLKSYVQGNGGNSAYGMQGGGQATEARFQYDVLKTGIFRITPYAGVGGQKFDFTFDGTSPPDLNTALQTVLTPADSRRIDVEETFLSGGISAGISKLNSTIGYGFGLQLGYQYVTRGTWRLNEELLQTPSSSFSGLEIKLSIALLFDITPKTRSNNPQR